MSRSRLIDTSDADLRGMTDAAARERVRLAQSSSDDSLAREAGRPEGGTDVREKALGGGG